MKLMTAATVLLILAVCQSAMAASGDARSSRRGGFYLAGGDANPGPAGVGIGINLFSFFRVTYSLSGWAEGGGGSSNGEPHPANATAWASFHCTIRLGCTDEEFRKEVRHQMSGGGSSGAEYRSIVVNTFSAELLVPGWNFSPVVGVGQATYAQENKYYRDLDDSRSCAYYKAGFDWTGDGGGYLAFGASYNADLPKPKQDGGWGRLGIFF